MQRRVDVVTYEIVKNALVAASHEGSALIEKVAYHPIVSIGRDRSSSLLTVNGDMICHGHFDAAAHYGTFESSCKEFLKDIPTSQMKPGEAYVSNDAIRMGTHINEVRMLKPVFYKGELFCFAMTVIHFPDIGGPIPGSFNPRATEVYAEGLRIPPIKMVENDEIIEELWRWIAVNIRGSVERKFDFIAELEAAKLIERRVIEVLKKYGPETVQAVIEDLFDISERALRSEIAAMPDGEYYFEDFGDMDVMHPDQPPIAVRCTLTVKGDEMTFDYSASDPQPHASWGGARPTTIAGTIVGMMYCFPHLFPTNHGLYRPVHIVTKPGTCVHVLEPKGTSGYCSGVFDKLEAVSMSCLAQPLSKLKPHRLYPGMVGLANVVLGGVRPETGRDWIQYSPFIGGGGARSFKDGMSYFIFRFAPFTNTIPMELEERWFPIMWTKYEHIPDSCGHGKYRGGCGVERREKVLTDTIVTIHGDRGKFAPHGIAGGTNSDVTRLILDLGTPEQRDVGMYATAVTLKAGREMQFLAAGGGGYGSPLERDPQLLVEDVMDGYITLKTAREIYGVAIKVIDEELAQYEIDHEETGRLRAQLAKKPIRRGTGPHEVHPLGESIRASRDVTEEEGIKDCAIIRPPGW